MVERRVAVLVDGDNVGARHAAAILSEAGRVGRVDVARVYANATSTSGWFATPGYRAIHAGAGKNAADILLCIDAMEFALEGDHDTFVVATSDGDFTHLAQRLRERGLRVHGLGEDKCPETFRLACNAFMLLPGSRACSHPAGVPEPPSDFDQKIRSMIANHSKNGRGMRIADLSPKMYAVHGTRISTFPEGNWRAYLAARPFLYDLDARGPDAAVRFRPEGFAAN